MKKRFAFLSLLIILFVNLVSASWIDDYLYDIGGFSTLIFITMIAIFFAILYLLLFARLFRDSRGVAVILSGLLSLTMAYGVMQVGWDIESFIYSLGIPSDLLWLIGAAILFLFIFIISRSKEDGKFRFYRAFILIGLSLIGISFTEIVYENGTTTGLGIVILLFGLWRWNKARKKKKYSNLPLPPSSNKSRKNRFSKWRDYQGGKVDQRYDNKLEKRQKEFDEAERQKQIKERAKRINVIRKRRERNEEAKRIADEAKRNEEMKMEKARRETEEENRRRDEKVRMQKEKKKLLEEREKILKYLNKLAAKNPNGNTIKKGDPPYKIYKRALKKLDKIDSKLKD